MDKPDLHALLVEDDPLIAESLRLFLISQKIHVAGVAHNASMAFNILRSERVDLAILDVDLGGGMTGIDIAEHINQNYDIPFVFLTAFDDDKTLAAAQEHTPYGYLVKPFQERSLTTTIKMALANFHKLKTKSTLVKSNLDEMVVGEFTKQEFVIIQELVAGKTYNQIATDNFISANTVKFHAKNIYAKLDVRGRAELVSRVY